MLDWKALRLSRSQGYWTKFNQTNETVGLDGLDDPELIKEYDAKVLEAKAALKSAHTSKSSTPAPSSAGEAVKA
ncbi:unnamed protein product [Ambrosiozyma monospora]|uniref:Unnamed protein product n=1 Tax=Ambrosiozyma monospora TaxID=43982 RepID=A0ACB5TDI0_AMBMO|nr:unnamed protein product [Ambrosiozyma monospora]